MTRKTVFDKKIAINKENYLSLRHTDEKPGTINFHHSRGQSNHTNWNHYNLQLTPKLN